MRRAGGAGAVLALGALLLAAPADARGLRLGVTDFPPFAGADNGAWYARAAAIRADVVRLSARWSEIAPARRAALRAPRDPADPAYRWARLDAAVQGAASQGLGILLTLESAPAWAEGSGRPPDARPGTWRPDPDAFADFVEAAARRYGGGVVDPARPGAPLPRVRDWQPWNEPNLPSHLAPQWQGQGRRAVPASPAWYRRMLNAAYARVKAVHPDNRVIAAGTAPYGDPPRAEDRMTPVRFLRGLLCVDPAVPAGARCRAWLDGVDHHPYTAGAPSRHAVMPGNVSIPDLGKLVRVLREAERAGTARPAGRKSVLTTELSWDSAPPDPYGVPEARRARWLQESFYRLWRQGVTTICWYLLRDTPPVPDFGSTYQSGLFDRAGDAKLSATAFRFPFVARSRAGFVTVWGRAPLSGEVRIERRDGTAWTLVATVGTGPDGIFHRRLPLTQGIVLRARSGAEASLPRRAA
jgi:hypothetical protein